MKTFLYTLLFFTFTNSYSQPTVGPDAIVYVGEDEPTLFLAIDQQDWNSGMQGQNVLWDYSTLSSGEACDYVAIDPMLSPYFDSFPDSDIYFVCTFTDSQGYTTEQHTYYNVEGTILQLAGNVSISLSNPSFDSIFTVFTDPLNWGTFPYSYEDISEDSFEARITSYIGEQMLLAIQNGTSMQEVDSYGTLITPSGTFENTLRVSRTEVAENSIPGIPFTSPQESYRYTWYAENENGVILNLDSIVIKDFNGNVVNTSLQGSYRIASPTSTSAYFPSESDISVYPNPTAQEINVELINISDYKLYIYTVNGAEVPYDILESSEHLRRIKLANTDIIKGSYFMTIAHKESGEKTTKIIIVN